jgi:hypothetical protein
MFDWPFLVGKARTRGKKRDKTEGIELEGMCYGNPSNSWELLLLFKMC